nr:hypothetical protein Iba_chr15aCG10130 [Ipomoea batatas]
MLFARSPPFVTAAGASPDLFADFTEQSHHGFFNNKINTLVHKGMDFPLKLLYLYYNLLCLLSVELLEAENVLNFLPLQIQIFLEPNFELKFSLITERTRVLMNLKPILEAFNHHILHDRNALYFGPFPHFSRRGSKGQCGHKTWEWLSRRRRRGRRNSTSIAARVRVRVYCRRVCKVEIEKRRELTLSWWGLPQPCPISPVNIHVATKSLGRSELPSTETASVGSWRP